MGAAEPYGENIFYMACIAAAPGDDYMKASDAGVIEMPVWRMGLLGAALCFGGVLGHAAVAQDLTGVNGGLNSDNGALSGATINRVNGINANGTPRQQDPGASITNGAGNSAMTPGVVGPVGSTNNGLSPLKTVPPTVILHSNESSGTSP